MSWAPACSVKQGHLTLPGSANFLILTIQTGEIWNFDPPMQQNFSIVNHPGRSKLPLTHPGKSSAGAPDPCFLMPAPMFQLAGHGVTHVLTKYMSKTTRHALNYSQTRLIRFAFYILKQITI